MLLQHAKTSLLDHAEPKIHCDRRAAQRIVVAAHSPVKVILFGSYATGKARENSDIDLLVVEDEIPAMAA